MIRAFDENLQMRALKSEVSSVMIAIKSEYVKQRNLESYMENVNKNMELRDE